MYSWGVTSPGRLFFPFLRAAPVVGGGRLIKPRCEFKLYLRVFAGLEQCSLKVVGAILVRDGGWNRNPFEAVA